MISELLKRFKEWLQPPPPPKPGDTDSTGALLHRIMTACPCCGLRPPEYMQGPAGGMTVNIYCGACGEGFNVSTQLGYAEKIGKNRAYILNKYKGENKRHGT